MEDAFSNDRNFTLNEDFEDVISIYHSQTYDVLAQWRNQHVTKEDIEDIADYIISLCI